MDNPKVEDVIKIDWSKLKFISREDQWYVEGTEANCKFDYGEPRLNDIVENNVGIFQGMTMEKYTGFDGELPRPDEEGCPFEEFDIYLGEEVVNLLTYRELIKLI